MYADTLIYWTVTPDIHPEKKAVVCMFLKKWLYSQQLIFSGQQITIHDHKNKRSPPPKTPHHPTISQLPLVSFQKLDQERDFCCWPISLSAFTHLHWLFRNQSKTYLKLSSEQKLKSWTQHSAAVNKHTNVNYINRQKQAEIVPLVPIYTLTPSFTRAGSHLLWAYITSGDALHG